MIKESDIVYENGPAWVYSDRKKRAYVVYVASSAHSTSDSAYPLNADGLSIAKARADYIAAQRRKRAALEHVLTQGVS